MSQAVNHRVTSLGSRLGLVLAGIAVTLLLLAPSLVRAAEDPVVSAMQAELQRSMEQLQMEQLEKPYFLSYRIDDLSSARYSATFGTLLESEREQERRLLVDIRVGSPELDNSNFLTLPDFSTSQLSRGLSRLPLEDNEQEIRRALWLATDSAYKDALEQLAKKQASLQNKTRTDEVPDFSSEEPATITTDQELPELPDQAEAETLVQELSALFHEMPAIQFSTVRLNARLERSRYLDSNGSSFIRLTPTVELVASATTQAPDGMLLNDLVFAHGHTLTDLPAKEELQRRINQMGDRLTSLCQASLPQLYNGPVLVEGHAAAELLSQTLVPKLLAQRRPVAESPQLEAYLGEESSLIDKVNARILPRFMGIVDDPTLSDHDGEPLLGSYTVDDQGVPAAPTTVVKRGILKTLLATRTPVRGITASTGNRRGPGTAPSNLIVSADPEHGLSDEALRQELLSLVAERELEYGVIIRRIADPLLLEEDDPSGMRRFSFSGPGRQAPAPSVVAAYKLFPDGHEELLRNVQISGVEPGAFKDIVAVSQDSSVTTLPFTPQTSSPFDVMAEYVGNQTPLVSIVTPSLLFEDLTLKKPSGDIPKLPVAPHPVFAKKTE